MKRDLTPLPDGLTPHSLRRTFASVLYALGEDPGVVMDEMGHTSPALALRIYRQAMRRDEDEKTRLRSLVEGGQLADGGIRSGFDASTAAVWARLPEMQNLRESRRFLHGRGGFRTCDLSRVKRALSH